MEVSIIHDPREAYKFLRTKSGCDYVYQLYNLEPNIWSNTICYGLYEGTELRQLAMLSIGYGIPVLLAASFDSNQYNIELMSRIKRYLPSEFYTHIDKDTLQHVFGSNKIKDLLEYMNMGLDEPAAPFIVGDEVVRLGYENIADIKCLLAESYPEAWLDDELVKLNKNFGIYRNNKLISFSGIHAYSEEYQVAAIAHVTTHPDFRKQGLGEMVAAALVNDLSGNIKNIGLNVKVDNYPAINCYKKLGFKEYSKFTACEISI